MTESFHPKIWYTGVTGTCETASKSPSCLRALRVHLPEAAGETQKTWTNTRTGSHVIVFNLCLHIQQTKSKCHHANLIAKARKYDIKGKRYFESPMKCYATDLGIRNIHIGNRQLEMPHLVENALYNELVRSGYTVDVGEVSTSCRRDGKIVRKTSEIDFVVNRGYERIYIQSAWMIPDAEKWPKKLFR